MRALLFDGSVARVREVSAPVRTAGEARVAVRTAGVCDTDLQLCRGYLGFRGVLGHEFVGEVVEAEDPSWLGRRVVGDINAGCGRCDDCQQRDGHHCAARTVLGIVGRSGALAEELTLPQRCLVAVPDGVSDAAAVFAEPLAAALHVLDEVRDSPDAIVIGDGKLGLLCALALRGAGVNTHLVGRHARKLALAARAGVHTALDGEADALRAPLVVEASGSKQGLAAALRAATARGTVVLKTTIAGSFEVDLTRVVVDELRVVGSRCGDLNRAVAALAAGAVDPTPLIDQRFALHDAEQALVHAGTRGVLKVLVDVQAGATDGPTGERSGASEPAARGGASAAPRD